jgi:hypothetical protein
MAKTREQASQELEDTKKQLTELNRKLEQRCYRLESEKQSMKLQNETTMEETLKRQHDEIGRLQEDKFNALEQLRREYEDKV